MAYRRSREAADRFEQRRRREDDAARLSEIVPHLESLQLELEDKPAAATAGDIRYVRHIVVQRAPAVFFVPCTDKTCDDGGHDLTHVILKGLKEGRPEFEGHERCYGHVGNVDCGRILYFVAKAAYRE